MRNISSVIKQALLRSILMMSLWNGKAISAKTPVTLIGEVDIDHKPAKRIEIDVDQVHF